MPRATRAGRYELARQAWEILVEVAEQPERGTITYGELAEELNARTGRNLTGQHMRGPLILITDYCVWGAETASAPKLRAMPPRDSTRAAGRPAGPVA